MSWRGVVGFVVGFGLAVWLGVAYGASLQWVRGPGGVYQAYDSTTGALIGDGSVGSMGTLVADGTATGNGDWVMTQTLGNLWEDSSLGELALTGVDVGEALSPAGVVALGVQVLPRIIQGLGLVGAVAQLAAELGVQPPLAGTWASDMNNTGYPSECPSVCSTGSVEYCTPVGYGSWPYGAQCETGYAYNGTQDGSLPNSYAVGNPAYQAPPGASQPATFTQGAPLTSQAIEGAWQDVTPNTVNFPSLSSRLKSLLQSDPSALADVGTNPLGLSSSYSGPATETLPSVSVSTNGQTSTVTPSFTPTYSPGGVKPNLTYKTCTGTAACSTTTVSPSNTSKLSPFVAPTGGLPTNPTLTPTGTALTLNVTPVQGTCPPPVLLNLTAEGMGSYSIPLTPLCTLASYVYPVVVASSAVAAGFIILQ